MFVALHKDMPVIRSKSLLHIKKLEDIACFCHAPSDTTLRLSCLWRFGYFLDNIFHIISVLKLLLLCSHTYIISMEVTSLSFIAIFLHTYTQFPLLLALVMMSYRLIILVVHMISFSYIMSHYGFWRYTLIS